ncbi:QacE family quaternary ammonium compound efflux SMR transporter [Klebsiella pneumoniae]|nr:QacE family quaternary ammonium compound efflux SMR transporter [Klebsiella pneumoniae]
MKGWLFLVIAIVGEVIATSALKSSEGFTKLAPSAVVIIGYGIAFYFLSLVLKSIPVGVAYAVWSGLGVVIITAIAWLLHGQKLDAWGFVGMGLIIAAFFARPIPIVEVAAEADAMVTVFGILNLTEDSFFDESRRLDPAGAVTAAIEMLRVGSDVVDVGPAASHPDARPVSPADEIRRIAPLLDALSDQMHRVSIDSFQPETQRYALKRGVGYLNDIQGFPDPALYPDIAEADCRLVVMHSAQRDGIATRTGHLRPEDALDEIVRFFEARVSALRRSGVAADRLILDPGMDRRLVHGETADLAPTGFGQQVREAMDQRREHHIEQRDATRNRDGRIFYRRNLLATLREREVARAGAEMAEGKALPFRAAKDGESVSGKFTGTVQLTSGKFAIVEKSHEFTLVPWRPIIDRQLGREVAGIMQGGSVSWQLGRQRGLGL